MSEELSLPANGTKSEIYESLFPQFEALVAGTGDLIANLANTAAVLKTAFDFHWVGFYRTTAPGVLTLGPFQGPPACIVIPFERGVCGKAARTRETVIVDDVEKFEDHIVCSSLSRSEIVVPLVASGETKLVLDIDSVNLAAFDAVDRIWLERVVAILARLHFGTRTAK